jgi:hypothetical protein
MNSSSEEWQSNLILYLKKVLQHTKTLMIQNYTKPLPKAFGTKNEEQFDLLVVLLPRIKKALQGHQPFNTLENTSFLQIIQVI